MDFPNVNRYMNKGIDVQPHHMMKLWRARPKIFMIDVFDVTLFHWQEDCVQLYQDNQRLAMIACKGPGKEESVNNIIYTPQGLKRFGDLKVGDEVFSEYGMPTRIKGVYPQGVKDIYEVTFDDGSMARCGLEHLWKVRGRTEKRHGTWSVLSLKEILERGISIKQGGSRYHQFQIPVQGAAQFSEKDLSIDPYLFGVWLGDGGRVSGRITSGDSDELIANLRHRGIESHKLISKHRCPAVRINGLAKKLRDLGVLDKYSYEKSIPEIYKQGSIEQRLDLLRGLMDSDGTIDTRLDKGQACEYYTTSEQLALDVMHLVRSLGGKCSMVTKTSKLNGVKHRNCYRVRITMPVNPFLLERKAKHWKAPSQDRYLMRTIKKVEKALPEEAMCIEVECSNHCYLTNDFIVTHNTALLNFIGWHFFLCFYQPKIAALSISEAHLKANLWAELQMWGAKSELVKRSVWLGQSQRIALRGHESYSFIDARAYPKSADETQQASALAGLHADNTGFLIDEAGSIPDAVLATADAALSTGDSDDKRKRLVVTGNPEQPKGLIYRAYLGQSEQDWKVYTISADPDLPDSERAENVSRKWAQEQINTYGRDHPWVKVNVLAEYPETSADMLISEMEIDAAMKREISLKEVRDAQVRLGLDVARGGADSNIYARRQGLIAFPMEETSSDEDGPTHASRISYMWREHRIERVYVDDTGGYGSTVIDSCMRYPEIDVTGIKFNSNAQDKKRYANKRTENWVRMRDWIRRGGKLPNDPKLKEDLLAPLLFFHGGVLKLESKEQIRKRLGRSPDRADALSETFNDPEELSFYADEDNQGRRHSDVMRANTNNYISDASQLDKDYDAPSNYKA